MFSPQAYRDTAFEEAERMEWLSDDEEPGYTAVDTSFIEEEEDSEEEATRRFPRRNVTPAHLSEIDTDDEDDSETQEESKLPCDYGFVPATALELHYEFVNAASAAAAANSTSCLDEEPVSEFEWLCSWPKLASLWLCSRADVLQFTGDSTN